MQDQRWAALAAEIAYELSPTKEAERAEFAVLRDEDVCPFKIGDLVRLVKNPSMRMAAKPGTMALVIGIVPLSRWVRVEWSAFQRGRNEQRDGAYSWDIFEKAGEVR